MDREQKLGLAMLLAVTTVLYLILIRVYGELQATIYVQPLPPIIHVISVISLIIGCGLTVLAKPDFLPSRRSRLFLATAKESLIAGLGGNWFLTGVPYMILFGVTRLEIFHILFGVSLLIGFPSSLAIAVVRGLFARRLFRES